MKRTRFSEEQIIGVLHEAGGGVSIREVCRKHGITEQTRCSKMSWDESGDAAGAFVIMPRSDCGFCNHSCLVRVQGSSTQSGAVTNSNSYPCARR